MSIPAFDAPTPNPDADKTPPSLERIWRRFLEVEKEQRLIRADMEKELRNLRNDFSTTTESIKDDFASLNARIEMLEEDVTETKTLVTSGNRTNEANNGLLQGIDRKLGRLVPA